MNFNINYNYQILPIKNYAQNTQLKQFSSSKYSNFGKSEQDIYLKNIHFLGGNTQESFSEKQVDNFVGNFNNKINLIFSDIDGTMIPFDNSIRPRVPQSSKNAIAKLKKANIPLVLVSGRSLREVEQISTDLNLDNSYFILYSGAEITNSKNQPIFKNYINGTNSKKIINCFQNFKETNGLNSQFYVLFNGEETSTKSFTIPYNGKKVTTQDYKTFDASLDYFGTPKISIYESNPKIRKEIQQYLKSQFANLNIDLGGTDYIEISNKSATKGNAIKILTEKSGINLKNVAVFGDAENDISMIKMVKNNHGLSIAMNNACDSLKEESNYITKNVNDGGVEYAIDKIIANNALL